MSGAGAVPFVDAKIAQRPVLLFSKSHSPECREIRAILDSYQLLPSDYEVVEIECRQDCTQIENYFQTICLTDRRAVPQLFVRGKYVGGEKELHRLHNDGKLEAVLKPEQPA